MYLVCNEPILVSRVRDVNAPLGIRDVWFIALQVNKLWKKGGICKEDTVFYNYKDNEVHKLTGKDFLELLKYHNEQIKPSILDDKEKEYLRNVIRPFRDKIKHIVKRETLFTNCSNEYIVIALQEGPIIFPNFKEGTMYKGMKVNKTYTLKELGL